MDNSNIDTDAAAQRIRELSEELRRFNYEYFVRSSPSVSDLEYDRRFDELKELEAAFPELVAQDSPSLRVGSDLSADLPERPHSIPVLSLDKAYSIDEIRAWMLRCSKQLDSRFSIVIEEKMDGSSLVLYYEQGLLVRALSRGNGRVGNDITENVRTIRSIPLRLSQPLNCAVRGEVFMTIGDFNAIKSDGDADAANPRNFASGSLRRKKSSEVARVPLRFFAYEPFGEDFSDNHSQNLSHLQQLGFSVNPNMELISVDPNDEADVQRTLEDIDKYLRSSTLRRPKLDYEIDGMVLKIDQLELRDELGYTGHHPRWAIAYKFESPEGRTRVLDIDLQIGRTGRATPVARVAPVAVGGTTIQNVTLHNQDYINSLELAVGDQVAVSRRGDVIPAVERVLEKGDGLTWTMPDSCPSCSSVLEKRGAHHFCPNFDCASRKRGRLTFFTGRDQMDIDNLGSETVITLLDAGLISDVPDLFRLDYEKLAQLPGFGEKKVELIRKGLEEAKSRPYRRVIVSLGLNDFGPKLAELLEDNGYGDIDRLFEIIDQGKQDGLIDIKGIGEKTVQSVCAQLSEPRFRQMVAQLKELGLNFRSERDPQSERNGQGPLSGQRWCITGSFDNFKPRSKAGERIKQLGGELTGDVSGQTTHLLAGSAAGGKLAKAQKLGVEVVDEAAFLQLLEDHSS